MGTPERTTLPVYQQVANILRSQIAGLDADRPVRLPNELQLAQTHRVSRVTIHRALQILRDEGLIEQARGRGTVTIPAGIRTWRGLHKSRVIKVISSWQIEPDVPLDFYGQIYQGIMVGGQQAGYRVSLARMGGHFPRIKPTIQPEDPGDTVGVILISLYDERIIQMHIDAGYPLVCTDYWTVNPQADAVMFDCFAEGVKATEFLLSQGHRHLFYLGNSIADEDGRQRHECDADLMEAGCRRALQEAGLTLPARCIRFYTHRDLEQAVAWFASLRPRPTAGVTFSAGAMEAFLRCLPQYGLRCPDDVSLICKAATGWTTPAASLRNDPFLIGRFAVDLLLERAAGKRHASVRLALESTLHRGTTVRRLQP